jgi:hypothetical protein
MQRWPSILIVPLVAIPDTTHVQPGGRLRTMSLGADVDTIV